VKTKLFWILLAFVLFVACPMFAQGTPSNVARTATDWVAITSGFAMAIASAGCGLGMGRAIGSATEGMARNPGAAAAIRGALILGLVLIESLALYVIVIIFVKVVP
jgi:F-type H+-transporting ATPase subunit c